MNCVSLRRKYDAVCLLSKNIATRPMRPFHPLRSSVRIPLVIRKGVLCVVCCLWFVVCCVWCHLYCVLCDVCGVLCILCGVLCILCGVLCILCGVLCISVVFGEIILFPRGSSPIYTAVCLWRNDSAACQQMLQNVRQQSIAHRCGDRTSRRGTSKTGETVARVGELILENWQFKIRRHQFHNSEEVEIAVRELLRIQQPDFYRYGISKTLCKFKTNTSLCSAMMMTNNDTAVG
jgi:hypothetical protein